MNLRAAAVPVTVLAGIVVCGCGGGSAATDSTSPASPLGGSLTVFAASSLAPSFNAAAHSLASANPGLSVTYSFAGSQQLAQNILDGAPADVIATADLATMQRLVAAALVGTQRVFARNVLEIAVAPGNPKHIGALADLARPDVAVVLADPAVPAGAYAAQALRHAGIMVAPRSLELSVSAALEKVESGDADAAIVYRTDVAAAAPKVDGVVIPDADNVIATYEIAALRGARNPSAAQAYVAEVLTGTLHQQLLQHGFLTA